MGERDTGFTASERLLAGVLAIIVIAVLIALLVAI